MKYIVLEIQATEDSVATLPPVIKDTRMEAESEYHIKLGYAAISQVRKHSVVLLDDKGSPIYWDCYEHIPEPDLEPVIEDSEEEEGGE